MNVTFKGVSEDSRCPEGAQCIWAGVALAQVEVMGTSTRPMTLNLTKAQITRQEIIISRQNSTDILSHYRTLLLIQNRRMGQKH